MSDGRILLSGAPEEVFSHHDTLVENGLAVPEVTDILSLLKKDGYDVNSSCFTVESAAEELRNLFLKK